MFNIILMTNCPICCEKIGNMFVILSCQCHNLYHKTCIDKWLKIDNSCPTCRQNWLDNPFTNFNNNKELLEEIRRRLWQESIGIHSGRHFNTPVGSLSIRD